MSKEPTRYLRREFLGQCAAVPLVVNVAAAAEPPQSQPAKAASVPTPITPDSTITRLTTDEIRAEVGRLMQFVEPEVAYHYTPLPPDKNAWPHWAKAHAAYVSYESDEELKRVLEETVLEHDRWPDGNERDLVLKWLTANEAAKKLIDQGIAVGHVELPRDPNAASLSLAMDEISLVRELALLKSICCTRALAERRHDEAAREAFSLLEMGSMLLRGQCMLVDYLVGMAIYGMGAACIGRVGLHDAVARRLKRECIEQLTTNKLRREDLKQALRVEYCRWFLPQIAAYPDVSPRGLARWYVESEDNADCQPTARQKKARDRYIDTTAFLLDEHPRPFDKKETVRLSSKVQAESIRNIDRPWSKQTKKEREAVLREIAVWPTEIEREIFWSGMMAIVPDDPDENKGDQVTEKALADARRALRKVDNPFGKNIIRQMVSSITEGDPLFPRSAARIEAIRLQIALRMFEQVNNTLPKSLKGLVDQGILPEVLRDPFDGKDFKYSAKRRVFWSVGPDGKNKGIVPEVEDPENPLFEDIELTWRIKSS